jgi:pimeloyl-ACP methyl ester carboxylesterase
LHGQQEWLTESLSCSRDASQELTRITVPTSLIWGRHDRVMRLRIAQAASARYGWPLHVIEDAGHFLIEQPEAFRAALQAALGDR